MGGGGERVDTGIPLPTKFISIHISDSCNQQLIRVFTDMDAWLDGGYLASRL